jgi:hypothetical protein
MEWFGAEFGAILGCFWLRVLNFLIFQKKTQQKT